MSRGERGAPRAQVGDEERGSPSAAQQHSFLLCCPFCPKLYTHLFPIVRDRLVAKLPAEVDAQNMAAEVCTLACQEFRCRGSADDLEPFVSTLARRAVVDFWRRRATRETAHADLPPPVAEADPERTAVLRVLVSQALAKLPEKTRAVVLLHEVGGHAIPKIAAALDLGIEAAYKRLARGRTQLTASLQEAGLGPNASHHASQRRTGDQENATCRSDSVSGNPVADRGREAIPV